jgi:hypothetical protein
MALNSQQSVFVAAYLRNHNATQAAIKAGYSDKTAKQIGSRLLKHPEIQAIISAPIAVREADNQAIVEAAVDRWRSEMESMAFTDTPVDDFKYDHKLRALDMIAKAEGRYASDTGSATAFQININLGDTEQPTQQEPVEVQQVDDD